MIAEESFDAVVIGAGVGGVSVAARLAQSGYRVLLSESLDRVGGRASSREVDGFILNTGAVAIELDGPIAELYHDLGLHLDLHTPRPAMVVLWKGRVINATTGPGGWVRELTPSLLRRLTGRIPALRPLPGQSTTEWLTRLTRNKTIHGLVDNVCGAFFAAMGSDLPADVFLSYMSAGSAFKKLGFAPGGTIEVWKPLLSHVESTGGEIWLNAPATRLLFDDRGLATGVEIDRDGLPTRVHADVIVSNIGPLNTVRLADPAHWPAGYPESVADSTNGAAILTLHFASQVALASWPGAALAGRSRRLTYAVNASAPEQRMISQPGWHLYAAASTPHPATGPFDVEEEKELLLADVRDYFPGFDQHAKVLAWDIAAHDEPAQRAISGFDLPVETPVRNLWNVGDGVKPWADAGTAACVRTANRVAEQIVERFPARGRDSAAKPRTSSPTVP